MLKGIYFTDKIDYNINACSLKEHQEVRGRIVLGSLNEAFVSSIGLVTKFQYLSQWACACARIMENYQASAFITDYTKHGSEYMGMWWILYRMNRANSVIIQNHLLLKHIVGEKFDFCDPFDHIPPYENVADDGCCISEWHATLKDVENTYRDIVSKCRQIHLA